MVDWRPTTWILFSMPAGGTYNIASAHMVDWRPTTWYLLSMPAGGTYNIASAHMVDWRPTTWMLYSMPAGGTYNIASADMVNWRPTTWYLYSMPAGTYSFAAACMRYWTDVNAIRADGLGLSQSQVDTIIADIYAGRMGYTYNAPSLNIGGTNAAPSGVYQDEDPPVTGKGMIYELVNDPEGEGFKKWTITYTT